MRLDRHDRPLAAVFAPARMGRRAVLAAALLAGVAACSKSPEKQAAESVGAVRSWTATARLVSESWLQHKVPSVYARTTLEKAAASLTQEVGTLEAAPPPPEVRGELPLLRAPAAAAGRLAQAVKRDDRDAARRELAALAGLDERIGALDERLSPRQ
jgi:hypothetical protein